MNGETADGSLDGLFRDMAEQDGLAVFLGPPADTAAAPMMKFCSWRNCGWEAAITDASLRCPECDGPLTTGLRNTGSR